LEVIIPQLNRSPSFLLLSQVGTCGLLLVRRCSLSKVRLLLHGPGKDGFGNLLGMLNF
jgi:hypothetical protein